MAKYRKKPVVIDAVHLVDLSYETVNKALAFMGKSIVVPRTMHGGNPLDEYMRTTWKDNGIKIETLEGVMLASIGDYIIKGVKGEFYPCKPDIFEATYEIVE